MRKQLKQVFFLSLFGFLCTVFVFFVPIGSSDSDLSESSQDKSNLENLADNQEINQDSIVQDSVEFSGNLRIAIKKGMIKESISRFIDEFLEQHGGSIEFVEVSSPDEWASLEGIDLYLIPYDVLTGMDFEGILFQEDISQLFISQLKNFIKEHNNLIPFGLDLPIVYGLSNLSEGMDGLVSDATSWTPSRSYGPFNFGISADLATYDNSLISSQQVIDFIEVNNVGAFSQWIDFTASSQDLQNRLLSAIQGSSDLCKEYPLSCLIEKKLLGLAWGFKSDYDQGFENKVYWKKYPYEGKSQFVRLYSFAIAKGSENYSMAIQFILDYMDNAFSDGNISMSKSIGLVPVFENEFSNFCYQDSCGISNNVLFLEDGFKKIDRFYTDSVLWNVLGKKVQPNLYLLNTLL